MAGNGHLWRLHMLPVKWSWNYIGNAGDNIRCFSYYKFLWLVNAIDRYISNLIHHHSTFLCLRNIQSMACHPQHPQSWPAIRNIRSSGLPSAASAGLACHPQHPQPWPAIRSTRWPRLSYAALAGLAYHTQHPRPGLPCTASAVLTCHPQHP